MVVAFILACEIAFWVLLGVGLAVRYLLRRPRASAVLLICVPLLDVVVLVVSGIDLGRGASANSTHGLAAAYLGFSVMFGHSMVRWADQRFAHRFAGGPPPWRPPEQGPARIRYEWREWAKAVSALAIASGLLLAGILWIDDAARTAELASWIGGLSLVIGIWFVVGPLWTTLFRKPLF